MSMFCCNLSGLDDLGIVEWPSSIWYRSKICPGVFPYFSAIFLISSSLMTSGSPGSAHGLEGEPKGLYPTMEIWRSLQNLRNFSWLRYGWTSICQKYVVEHQKTRKSLVFNLLRYVTWFTAGITLLFLINLSICALVKFEIPMDFANPFSYTFSIAFHVSR